MQDMQMAELENNASEASGLLKVMSNQWRLLILCHLTAGEQSVQELQRILGMGQSALSQHLAILRYEKLVTTRREAQSIYYSLASKEAETVLLALHDIYCDTGIMGAK